MVAARGLELPACLHPAGRAAFGAVIAAKGANLSAEMGAVLVAAAARGALAAPAVSDVGPLLAKPPRAGE
eukprot:7748768-Alexandrium_andersonii.AAC.1